MKKRRKPNSRIQRWSLAIAILLALVSPAVVSAATLVIDGQFDDWVGQSHITDPVGDGPTGNSDLTAFYWGTNPGESATYFMFERVSANGATYFGIQIDTNNDGDFDDADDRLVLVRYQPFQRRSLVTVWVLTGQLSPISSYSGDWGESRQEGGSRAEVSVSFQNLGIDAHQTINMVAHAGQAASLPQTDRAPDTGTITWSPIPALGWFWLAAVAVVVIGIAWYTRGRFKWRGSSPLE